MELAGWHAIFVVMFAAVMAVVVIVHFFMVETVERDLSRIKPRALMQSYGTLLTMPYFVLCSLVLAGTVGAIYTQAMVLPFILMERVGLTPTEFGMGMLLQSGMFFIGALTARWLMPYVRSANLVPVGLGCVAIGSMALALSLGLYEPTFVGVMGPVGVHAFGIAFVMPAMLTAALAPFPHIAGAASSMSGFFQMGGGLLGGMICALIAEPVSAMATAIPVLGLLAIISWLVWRMLPEPVVGSPNGGNA